MMVKLRRSSNSGYQFFDAVCTEHQMQCDTANGKSNIFSYLKVHKDEKILVIADGAAFGPEMDMVLQLVQTRKNLALYLPESFECLVLSSGISSCAICSSLPLSLSWYTATLFPDPTFVVL